MKGLQNVVAVMILIMGALNHVEFKRRNPNIEPRYAADVLDRFGRRFPLMIACGVGLILVAVILLIGMSPEDGHTILNGTCTEEVLLFPFMFTIAVGVGLIMWAGLQKSKYDLSELTYIGHRRELGADLSLTVNVKSPEQLRAERIMGVICGAIMLVATIVFLVWGLVPLFDQVGGWSGMDKGALRDVIRHSQGGFGISWIAFAVGGILCGIVYLVGSVAFKSQDDWIAEAKQEDAWLQYAQSNAKEDPWARGAQQATPSVPPAPGTMPPTTRSTPEQRTSTWK